MASKVTGMTSKNNQLPISLNECEKIITKVNNYKRKKGVSQPFKNQDYAIKQLLSTIDLYNKTVYKLITNPTLIPKNQKKYYSKLNKRVSKLLEFLQEGSFEYLERIYLHQMDKNFPKKNFTGEEPVNPKKLINTLIAYSETINHLHDNPINKNRKGNHRDDLNHLINLLFQMYINCSIRTPGYTYDKNKVYKGDFVLLIELVIPHVNPPFEIRPTNEAIGEGIKLCTKYSL